MPYADPQKRREVTNQWRRSEAGRKSAREAQKRYRETEAGRAAIGARMRKWRKTETGRAYKARQQQIERDRYPERIAARVAVNNAVRDGRLVRGSCEYEDESCQGKIEAHHDDYSKPLDVRWLCERHHRGL